MVSVPQPAVHNDLSSIKCRPVSLFKRILTQALQCCIFPGWVSSGQRPNVVERDEIALVPRVLAAYRSLAYALERARGTRCR